MLKETMTMIFSCFLAVIMLMLVCDICYGKSIPDDDDIFERCIKEGNSTGHLMELSTDDSIQYKWFKLTGKKLRIKVKAKNDASIALAPNPSYGKPIFEVFIGAYKNTRTQIRKNKNKKEQIEAKTSGILDKGGFRSFWISWKKGYIEVGKEEIEEPILIWKEPIDFKMSYFGVHTGWGSTGKWIIHQEDKKLKQSSECRIYCQLKDDDLVREDDSFDFDKLNKHYFHKVENLGLASITCGIEECKYRKSEYTDKCGTIANKWRCIHSMVHAPGYIYFNSPVEDWNKRCYGSCILRSDGLLTKDGDFDFDAAKKHYREMEQENNKNSVRIAQSAMQAIDNCGKNISMYTNKCEAADWMYLCTLGNVKVMRTGVVPVQALGPSEFTQRK